MPSDVESGSLECAVPRRGLRVLVSAARETLTSQCHTRSGWRQMGGGHFLRSTEYVFRCLDGKGLMEAEGASPLGSPAARAMRAAVDHRSDPGGFRARATPNHLSSMKTTQDLAKAGRRSASHCASWDTSMAARRTNQQRCAELSVTLMLDLQAAAQMGRLRTTTTNLHSYRHESRRGAP